MNEEKLKEVLEILESQTNFLYNYNIKLLERIHKLESKLEDKSSSKLKDEQDEEKFYLEYKRSSIFFDLGLHECNSSLAKLPNRKLKFS